MDILEVSFFIFYGISRFGNKKSIEQTPINLRFKACICCYCYCMAFQGWNLEEDWRLVFLYNYVVPARANSRLTSQTCYKIIIRPAFSLNLRAK